MKILINAATVVVGLLAFGSAHAQSMRAGMWEMTRTSTDPAATAHIEELRKRLASATPEERKRAEAAMAASGQSLGSSPGQLKNTICISPEEAAEFNFSKSGTGGCKREVVDKKGAVVHFKTQCTGGFNGDTIVTMHGDTAFEAKITMSSPGMPAPRTMMTTGKWLSATCDKSAM